MKNKMGDVRDMLIASLEKLSYGEEDNVKEEDKMTAEKANAISNLGRVIIDSAKTELMAAKLMGAKIPTFFELEASKIEVKQVESKPVSFSTIIGEKAHPCKKNNPALECVDQEKRECKNCLFYDLTQKGKDIISTESLNYQ